MLWDGLPVAGGHGKQVAVIPAPRCLNQQGPSEPVTVFMYDSTRNFLS